MANLKVLIESVDSDTTVQALIDRQQPASGKDMQRFLSSYLKDLQSGHYTGSTVRFSACDAQASSDAVVATVIADDTATIGAKTLTAKASPASQDEFLLGANDAETADNLAACINANTDLKTFLSATSDGVNTVTVTCLMAGLIGNNIPTSSSGATISWTGSFLASGTDANNSTETM